jgi:hypothetical protein
LCGSPRNVDACPHKEKEFMRLDKLIAARTLMGTAAILSAFASPALAQERPQSVAPVRIELNKVEASGENCRTYFLIDNKSAEAWRSLKLDLFALDKDGVAAKRLAVEVGPVPGRKTLIKLFDFPGLSCQRFGRVLLNDVVACEGVASSREECLSAIETASKVESVPFAK